MAHFRSLTIKDIRKETPDCVSVSFEIPAEWKEEFQFIQGQNITIKTIIDGEETRRSYSICSSPLENELRIAVKKIPSGRFSTHANDRLNRGDSLEILSPTGNFYTHLNSSNKKNYLAFVAGSGITPVISIIKTVLATEPASSFTLVYGNRNRGSIIFKEELEALKNRYINRFSLYHILSQEKTDALINYGRIDVEKGKLLTEKLISLEEMDEVFICGPEEMTFNLKKWLQQEGVEKKKIHFELFATPGINQPYVKTETVSQKNLECKTSNLTIKSDGITVNFDLAYEGDPILDAAIKKGADLPFACKGGVCCTCKARLLEGEVEMDVNWGLEQDEIEAGFILTCQSHPRSEKIVIDFDAK